MKNKFLFRYIGIVCIAILALVMVGCETEPTYFPKGSDQQVISDYILANPDKYGEFGKILESTKLSSLLAVRGPFTLFLPTDTAMMAYYEAHNINSADDMTQQEKIDLVYNHLVANEIKAGDIGLGALRDTNALGDFIATEFQGSDIVLNKQSTIVKRNIETANGYIHLVDRVIEPLKTSVYDLLAADPSYSLFVEGLKRTGLKDTLQQIDFVFNQATGKKARNRFTLFAVPDSVFNRFGIGTIDQLIAKYSDGQGDVTSMQNGFYRYMEYHCLTQTYYLSGFAAGNKLYPILSSDNNISITVDTEFRINMDTKTRKYTSFYVPQSNMPAKNGTIHTVNSLMPVIQPDAVALVFETTDYFDLKQGDWYQDHYKKWPGSEGLTTFAKIKFAGDYLQYYYKVGQGFTNNDCLNMLGFYWVELVTPKIMKGKYRITSHLWNNWIDYNVYVDGVKTATVPKTAPANTTSWGEFNWTKTEEHTIRVVNISWGPLFWDYITFSPIR